MEPQELTNVTFDEIQVGKTAELTVTMAQHQIDVAAIVSGDVDAFYVKGPGAVDVRIEPRKTEAAGAEAMLSLLLGARMPGPGTKIVHRDLCFSGDFAAGDITCGGLQVVAAAGEGCVAALQALLYLRS